MAGHGDDELDGLISAWKAREATDELFAALRDPMRRAARRGIRRILARTPDDEDIDYVLYKAFKELLEADRNEDVRSLVGFAGTIAYRRGMDRARSIIREREQIKRQAWQIDQLRIEADDQVAAAEREKLLRLAGECMDVLTDQQRDVIEATVQRQASLSDWATARGTSYEAGRRMLGRGIAALRRCIDAKREPARRESSDG